MHNKNNLDFYEIELGIDLHQDSINELRKRHVSNQEWVNKIILFISGGGLFFILRDFDKIFQCNEWLAYLSLILFGYPIISGFISLYLSDKAIDSQIEDYNSEIENLCNIRRLMAENPWRSKDKLLESKPDLKDSSEKLYFIVRIINGSGQFFSILGWVLISIHIAN